MSSRIRNSPSSGFTLLELSISTVVLAAVGYAVSIAVKMGKDSNATVMQAASEARAERKTIATLIDLRNSSNARITVATDGNGNTQARIQLPIEVAGALTWGVRDRRLGADETAWNQENWDVRYAVDGEGRLVRRVVDVDGATQLEDVLAEELGGPGAPGFRLVQSGAIWQVEVVTRHGNTVSESEFHVRTRN
jgi:prepilin-type N-terminal cleavage/methylation domain-containing protein